MALAKFIRRLAAVMPVRRWQKAARKQSQRCLLPQLAQVIGLQAADFVPLFNVGGIVFVASRR